MPAITVTTLNLLGTETRTSVVRGKVGLMGVEQAAPIAHKVSSGNTGTTGTDTFTVVLDPRTTFVTVQITSPTTGTVTRSVVSTRASDTVGNFIPPVVAGGVSLSGLLPVLGGQTLVVTTGTLATAACTVIVHEYANRGVFTPFSII